MGVYIPNLVKKSPGAEDASARLKKMYMGGYNRFNPRLGSWQPDVQDDYVRDLIVRGIAEGFVVALQIDSRRTAADVKKLVRDDIKRLNATAVAALAANDAKIESHIEIIQATKEGYEWAEDNKMLTSDGSTIRTTPKVKTSAFAAMQKFTMGSKLGPRAAGYTREGHHTAGQPGTDRDRTSDEFPAGLVNEKAIQAAVSQRNEHLSAKSLADATGKAFKVTKTYNEGGNMLVGTFPNGQPYAVIGRDGLIVSVFHLEDEYKKPASDPTKVDVPQFDPTSISARMATLAPFDKSEVADTIDKLIAAGKIPAAASDADKKKAAEEFLTKLDLVKDIFADDTQIPRNQLIFVPQPDFHIDMHMRPLGPGQIMVNDFDANIALINDALKERPIEPWEEKELKTMLDHAKKMKEVMGPVMKEIAAQSKKGGLDVIPAPGVMESQFETAKITRATTMFPPQLQGVPAPGNQWKIGEKIGLAADKEYTRKDLGAALITAFGVTPDVNRTIMDWILDTLFTRHVNFMNAIPATKNGSNEQYYMTNHTSIKPLKKAYEKYLKKRGVESVEWVGDDGGGKGDRSSSELSLDAQGGLDCRENH
jgi:hypothetical protein